MGDTTYTKQDIKFLEDRVRSRQVHRKDDDVEHLLTILEYERAVSAASVSQLAELSVALEEAVAMKDAAGQKAWQLQQHIDSVYEVLALHGVFDQGQEPRGPIAELVKEQLRRLDNETRRNDDAEQDPAMTVKQWLDAMPKECESWWKDVGCDGSGSITIGGDSVQGYFISCPGCAKCTKPPLTAKQLVDAVKLVATNVMSPDDKSVLGMVLPAEYEDRRSPEVVRALAKGPTAPWRTPGPDESFADTEYLEDGKGGPAPNTCLICFDKGHYKDARGSYAFCPVVDEPWHMPIWCVWCVEDRGPCSNTIGTNEFAHAELPRWVSGEAAAVNPEHFHYAVRPFNARAKKEFPNLVSRGDRR